MTHTHRDNKQFQRTCEFYYGDATFGEAFERTRKHVCISVSASTLGVKNPVCVFGRREEEKDVACLLWDMMRLPTCVLYQVVVCSNPTPNLTYSTTSNRAARAGCSSTTSPRRTS
jgi:hypothetical protein